MFEIDFDQLRKRKLQSEEAPNGGWCPTKKRPSKAKRKARRKAQAVALRKNRP